MTFTKLVAMWTYLVTDFLVELVTDFLVGLVTDWPLNQPVNLEISRWFASELNLEPSVSPSDSHRHLPREWCFKHTVSFKD